MNKDSSMSHFGNMKGHFGFKTLEQLALVRATEEFFAVAKEPEVTSTVRRKIVFAEDGVEARHRARRGPFPSYRQIFQAFIQNLGSIGAYPNPHTIGDKRESSAPRQAIEPGAAASPQL